MTTKTEPIELGLTKAKRDKLATKTGSLASALILAQLFALELEGDYMGRPSDHWPGFHPAIVTLEKAELVTRRAVRLRSERSRRWVITPNGIALVEGVIGEKLITARAEAHRARMGQRVEAS